MKKTRNFLTFTGPLNFINIPLKGVFIANLFLYYYERKWLLDTKTKDLPKVHIFSNTFRFVEDLNSTNNHLEFDKNFKSMYTFQLQKHHF